MNPRLKPITVPAAGLAVLSLLALFACRGQSPTSTDTGSGFPGTGSGGSSNSRQRCSGPGDPYADVAVAFRRGPGPARGTEADALGAPDVVPPSTTGLVALGVGGTLILGFADNVALNGRGIDFRVFEATYDPNSRQPELAFFEVERCPGEGFLQIRPRSIAGDEIFAFEFDLADVGLAYASRLRIIDDGDTGFGGNGFDLDAVEVLSNCGDNLCLPRPPGSPSPPISTSPTPTATPTTPTPTPTPTATPLVGCPRRADRFADLVIQFRRGSGPARGQGSDALGGPDVVPPADAGLVALGVNGVLVLAFTQEAVDNGPGVDLRLYEGTFDPNSATPEQARFLVGECEGSPLLPIRPRSISGDEIFRFDFDLSDVGLARATVLRIEDDGDSTFGGNGFDVDAIEALHCEGPCTLTTPTPPASPTPPSSI